MKLRSICDTSLLRKSASLNMSFETNPSFFATNNWLLSSKIDPYAIHTQELPELGRVQPSPGLPQCYLRPKHLLFESAMLSHRVRCPGTHSKFCK
jgi:hypothetical protein